MKRKKYNPERHNRKSIRLEGFDYSQPAVFFVTILTRERECKLSRIVDQSIVLTDAGKLVKDEWLKTPKLRPDVIIDEYIIMPNHIHGIVAIANGLGEMEFAKHSGYKFSKFRSPEKSLGAIIRGFKSAVTIRFNSLNKSYYQPFWHENYHDRVITSEEDLNKAKKYIKDNPKNWKFDPYHLK